MGFASLQEFVEIVTVEDVSSISEHHLGNKTVNLTNMIEQQTVDLETRKPFPTGKIFYKLRPAKTWKSEYHKQQIQDIIATTAFREEFCHERKYEDIVNFNRLHYDERCHDLVNDVSLQANFDTSAPKTDFVPYKLRMNVRQLLLDANVVRKLGTGWIRVVVV